MPADDARRPRRRPRTLSPHSSKFEDLPDDVVKRILRFVEPKRYGVGFRRDCKTCLSLMRVSRRFFQICWYELYSTATLSRADQLERFLHGLARLPVGTLKHIEIFPSARWVVNGEEGFHIKRESISMLQRHCAFVETIDIYPSGQDGSSTLQADPASYLDLFLIINPRRLRVQCSMSPICAQLITYGRVPEFAVSALAQPSSMYSLLEDLHVPFLKFDSDFLPNMAAFAHLKMKKLRFDWPQGMTPEIVLAVLRTFESTLGKKSFTIAAPVGWLEQVCGCIPDGGNIKTSTEWFIEKNPGLTMLAMQTAAATRKEEHLLELLDWQISEYDFLALWTVPSSVPMPAMPKIGHAPTKITSGPIAGKLASDPVRS